jgi:hypothetical protein
MRPHRQGLLLLLALTSMGCVGLSPHGSPASMTDVDIATFRDGFRAGCTDAAIGHGKSRQQAAEDCSCILGTLQRVLTHEEWQRLTYEGQNGMESDELAAIASHVDALRSCLAQVPWKM